MKTLKFTRTAAFLTLFGAMLCLSSCDDDEVNLSNDIDIIDIPEFIEPTTDLMSVKVSADYPAAVLSDFAAGTTGAALVNRLTAPTKTINDDTRLVLIKGSEMASVSDEIIDQMLEVLLHNDFVAMETPTVEDLLTFVARVIYLHDQRDQDFIDANFDFGPGVERTANRASAMRERYNNRLNVMQNVAATRADSDIMDDVIGEIVVFSNREYFQQNTGSNTILINTISTDKDGNVGNPKPVNVRLERTPYRCGRMADAAADWLNGIDEQRKEFQAAATRTLTTRADEPDAINKLLNCSESFTLSTPVFFNDRYHTFKVHEDAVRITFNSWGVHNLSKKKDYYYIQEKVLVKMGEKDGDKIFCFDINDPKQTEGAMGWYPAIDYYVNGVSMNSWFGAFFTRYVTSMDLSGNGTISLEEALPYTDNSTTYNTVNIGSETGTSEEIGITWGVNISESPGLNVGGEYLQGKSSSNYFEMSTSVVSNDITVTKNTTDNKVTWAYKATLPAFKTYKGTDGREHISHTMPTQSTLNDINMNNEICWSVADPSGPYAFNYTTEIFTGSLLFSSEAALGLGELRYFNYLDEVSAGGQYSNTLLEPFRASQLWRMYVKVDEMMDGGRVGKAAANIEDRLRSKFSKNFHDEMTVFDSTPTSVQVITANIQAAKTVFDNNLDLLQQFAEEEDVKKYTIHWRCDSQDITYRGGYVVELP